MLKLRPKLKPRPKPKSKLRLKLKLKPKPRLGNDLSRGKNMRGNLNLTFSKRRNASLIQGRLVY
jgi:hypothetical protein